MDRISRLCLVDLAGSERADKTGATGVRLRESGSINKSLCNLGQVINALAEKSTSSPKQSAPHIPYRASTLTYLLSDSLGGNAKTIMLATVSPSPVQYEETLSTLRYADSAKKIVTHARVNEDPKALYIRSLETEVALLRQQLQQATCDVERLPLEPTNLPHVQQQMEAMKQQICTLTIQNFARATLLTRASQRIHTSSQDKSSESLCVGVETQSVACEFGTAAANGLSSEQLACKSSSDLPHLVRLSEEEPTGNEQVFLMSKDRTQFDEEGRIVGSVSPRPAAFIVDFADVYATVQPSRRLFVNGQEIYFKRSADAICMEIWNGTRLATDSSHVFLVVYEPASGGAEIPAGSVADQQRKDDHIAAWKILKTQPSLYWRAAQLEIRRGSQIKVEDVEAMIRGDPVDEGCPRSASSVGGFSIVTSSEKDAEGPSHVSPQSSAEPSTFSRARMTHRSHATRAPRLAKAHRSLTPVGRACLCPLRRLSAPGICSPARPHVCRPRRRCLRWSRRLARPPTGCRTWASS
jgi:hypothetical protein